MYLYVCIYKLYYQNIYAQLHIGYVQIGIKKYMGNENIYNKKFHNCFMLMRLLGIDVQI